MMNSLILRNVQYVFSHAHAKLRWGSLVLPVGILGVLKLFHDIKEHILTPLYVVYATGALAWIVGVAALVPLGFFALQCRFCPQPDQPAGILLTAAEQQTFSRYATRTLYAFTLWLSLFGCWGYLAQFGDPAAEQKRAASRLQETHDTARIIRTAQESENQKQEDFRNEMRVVLAGIKPPTVQDTAKQTQEAVNYEIVENDKVMLEQYLAQGGTLAALEGRSDGEGLYLLGIAKWRGWGEAAVDTKAALRLLERAVPKFPRARMTYGHLLYNGVKGLPPDPERAVTYWQDCADEGYAPCAYHLAIHYAYDLPQEKRDYYKSRRYLDKAAAKSHIGALAILGDFAWFGLGQKPDKGVAIKFYLQAAEGCAQDDRVRCSAVAVDRLGYAYATGEGVPQDVAQAKAWFEKAAAQNHAWAQHNLGVLYVEGLGASQDYAQAKAWWEKAAAQGSAGAQYNLGVMYDQGQGVARDGAKAKAWWEKAGEQGLAEAQYNLGVLHSEGRDVPQDYAQAKAWYEKAAIQGDAKAQYNLGLLYYEGQGVPRDYTQAKAWYEKAAAQGRAAAQTNLGVLYAVGRGVPKDLETAYVLFRLAAAQQNVGGGRGAERAKLMLTQTQLAAAEKRIAAWQPNKEGKLP